MKPLLFAICLGAMLFVAGCAMFEDDDNPFPNQTTSANADEQVPGATPEPGTQGPQQAGWKW
jgi:nitrous oxide reductase accessory protein NosL